MIVEIASVVALAAATAFAIDDGLPERTRRRMEIRRRTARHAGRPDGDIAAVMSATLASCPEAYDADLVAGAMARMRAARLPDDHPVARSAKRLAASYVDALPIVAEGDRTTLSRRVDKAMRELLALAERQIPSRAVDAMARLDAEIAHATRRAEGADDPFAIERGQ